MKNRIEDLRNHLFLALEGLADPENPLDLERARAIADVAQVVVNSAKVEVDYLKVMGAPAGGGSGFIPDGCRGGHVRPGLEHGQNAREKG